MKPANPPSWQKLAAAGRKELHRATSEPPASSIDWLPGLAGQVHAGFLRQIWRRCAVAGLIATVGIVVYLLLPERLVPPGNRLPSPRIPIPAAP